MIIEKELVITVLKLTRDGPASRKLISKEAKIPSRIAHRLLQKLQNDCMIYVQEDFVETDYTQRLKLVVHAVSLGADIERVSNLLQWQEFESVAAVALERSGYSVVKNLRFKHAGHKHEIDIVGCKKPLAICMDCKHWHRGMYPSTLKKITSEQVERTKTLADSFPNPTIKIECARWERVRFVPTVLSLVPSQHKFYDNVPVVSILQLQDFLNQLPAYVDSLFYLDTARRFSF